MPSFLSKLFKDIDPMEPLRFTGKKFQTWVNIIYQRERRAKEIKGERRRGRETETDRLLEVGLDLTKYLNHQATKRHFVRYESVVILDH